MREEWRCIETFPFYEVSDLGRVRSWLKKGPNGHRRAYPLVLAANVRSRSSPYLRVTLRRGDGKPYPTNIHDLVLQAFHGPKPSGAIGLHCDDDKSNNTAINLRWGTYSDNAADRAKNGHPSHGCFNNNAKLGQADIDAIRHCYAAGQTTQLSLASLYGVSQAHISSIVRCASWCSTQEASAS